MKGSTALLCGALLLATSGLASAQGKRIHFVNCGDGKGPGDAAQTRFIAEWEASNPGFKVDREFVPWAQCQEKTMRLASAGDAPAVAYLGSRTLKQLAQSDLILPIALSKAEKDSYAESVLRTVTSDGQVWGLPVAFSTKALYWNKDLFAKAGLNPEIPPKTWAEALAAAAAVRTKTDSYGVGIAGAINNQTFQNFLDYVYTNGGDVTNAAGEIVFNSPNTVEALQYYAELAKVGQPGPIAYNRVQLEPLFLEGKLGMIVSGPWLRNNLAGKSNWGVAPLPVGPKGRPSTILITDSLAVFKKTGVEEKAVDFAKWMTNPKNQLEYDIAAGYTPLRDLPGVAELRAKDPTWSVFLDAIPTGGPEPFVSDFIGLRDAAIEAIQSVILGRASAADAVARAAEKMKQFR